MTKQKVFILGQGFPQKSTLIPFKKAILYKWFEKIGLSQSEVLENCVFNALLDFYPGKINGSDIAPAYQEIQENIPRLSNFILQNDVKLIIPVGKLAVRAVLNDEKVELGQPNSRNKVICILFGNFRGNIGKVKVIHFPIHRV